MAIRDDGVAALALDFHAAHSYSVPYALIHELVDACLTAPTVYDRIDASLTSLADSLVAAAWRVLKR